MSTQRFRTLRLFLSLFILISVFGATGPRSRLAASVAGGYVPGELLVKFTAGIAPAHHATGVDLGAASLNALAAQYGVTAAEPLFAGVSASSANLEQIYKLFLAPTVDVMAAAETLSLDPNVVYAEPNYVLSTSQLPEPTDVTQPQPVPVEPLPSQPLDVQPLVDKANAQGNVRVIVGLRAAQSPAVAELNTETEITYRASIAQAQSNLLSKMSGYQVDNVVEIRFIPYIGMVVDANALRQLAILPEVTSVEEDTVMSPTLGESTSIVGGKTAWNLGYTGAGWHVAVLDTGVDKSHPFLKDKVVSEACFSTQGTQGSSTYRSVCPGSTDSNPITATTVTGSGVNCAVGVAGCEHGTHVAGIVAGKSDVFSGIAPGAKIVAIQVFSQLSSPGETDRVSGMKIDLIRGLERVYDLRNTFKIAAVNLSLGDQVRHADRCDGSEVAAKAAIDRLRSAGIATIVGSGNDGFKNAMNAPACISSAVSVASTDDGSERTRTDAVTPLSNSTDFLDLLAPGRWIRSSVPDGFDIHDGKNDGFASFEGTSMAAPHVAGIWALLREKAPLASVEQNLSVLKSTGKPIIDERPADDNTHIVGRVKPRLQVDKALDLMKSGLDFSDGSIFNFGLHPVGNIGVWTFSVTNSSQHIVDIISAAVVTNPFEFVGAYPGSGGTCGTSLSTGANCTVVVKFTPARNEPYTSSLQIVYRGQGETHAFTSTLKLIGSGGSREPVIAGDPLFPTQYGLHNTGQTGGTPDADIDAPEAWGIGTGSTGTMVAVIDSGVYYTHDDLNDGRVRTDIDWDYVNNDNDALDDNGHGTHVAGIIAAETNNGFGTAGVMWQARILPLKVCNSRGQCNADHIARAIRYAADQGARVINMSLGGSCSSTIADAVNYAHFDKGVIVVAAAGNNGSGVNFPAKHDPTIAVGATDKADKITSFSSRGDGLDIMAPGLSIMSTVPKNGHDTLSGTSMASPFVAGVAGLLLAQRPNLTNEQVRDILRGSADDLGTTGRDSLYGFGRVNAFKALQMPAPSNPTPSARAEQCPVCAAVTAARDSTDNLSLLSNLRTLRDQVFTQDPGQRWARIYYEHQFEVGWLVLSNAQLRSDVLSGWREFDPAFRALIDPNAPSVTLTPELIATARRVMVEGVAGNASAAVQDVIVTEWDRVNPDRFIGWDVRDVWEQLRKENGPKVSLPIVRH